MAKRRRKQQKGTSFLTVLAAPLIALSIIGQRASESNTRKARQHAQANLASKKAAALALSNKSKQLDIEIKQIRLANLRQKGPTQPQDAPGTFLGKEVMQCPLCHDFDSRGATICSDCHVPMHKTILPI